jgi:hypothetical protein
MLTGIVALVLWTQPACVEQVNWTWPSSSFAGINDGALRLRAFAWVSPKRDAFVIELADGRVFVGRGPRAAEVRNVDGWTVEQTALQFPLAQGAMELTPNGGNGKGCDSPEKSGDLGGPIAANVRIDARTRWRFELRDRSLKQLLHWF